METIFLNKVPYADIPFFLTHEPILLKYRWEPIQTTNQVILSYINNNSHHTLMRTHQGFYYKITLTIPLFRSEPFQYTRSSYYTTLAFLCKHHPIQVNPTRITPFLPVDLTHFLKNTSTHYSCDCFPLDIFDVEKYDETDFPILSVNFGITTYILYRTKEGFYYSAYEHELPTKLFPTIAFLNQHHPLLL